MCICFPNIYVFLLQSTFNCQRFQYLSETWEKVKRAIFCPQPTKKTMSTITPHRLYCQITNRCSISWMHCVWGWGWGSGGGRGRGEEWKGIGGNIKNKPHWGLISSKWLTSYKIFRCWQDDPAFEYKEVAPSLTKHRFNHPKQKSGLPSKTNMVFNLCDALNTVN